MPILCLEGPSAVGKTTVGRALAADHGAEIIPEVNVLYERPSKEAPEWYFERQYERWADAVRLLEADALVVLDGDPFQPLWYNWSYGFAGRQDLAFMESFYGPLIRRGDLSFPDRYVVLDADEATLRKRRDADPVRRRRRFKRHLLFVEPQHRYFEAMKSLAPDHVRFVEHDDVEETAKRVAVEAATAHPVARPFELFEAMVRWLESNNAAAYLT